MTADPEGGSGRHRVRRRVDELDLDRLDHAALSFAGLMILTLLGLPVVGMADSTLFLASWLVLAVVLCGVTVGSIFSHYYR